MTRQPHLLSARSFDVAIIGGGITGACLAHDAALRGLSVVLLERNDFGGATSAASSKLIHGGIRYLQQLQFGKVRESARERAAFLRIAPHLLRWVPFLIPTSTQFTKGRSLLGAGVGLYHLLSARAAGPADSRTTVPSSGFLNRAELLARYPVLQGTDSLTGAWYIHEAHMNSSERMSLALVASACRRGAVAMNYAEVLQVRREGARVVGVEVRDRLTDRTWDVAARYTINAAGPWIGALNAPLQGAALEHDINAFSKGVHLVTRPLLSDAAVAIATRHRNQAAIQRGGRHFFIIPWRGHSLIGTTNVPFTGRLDDVAATNTDVRRFIDDINAALPGVGLSETDVRYAYAGLYPLTETEIRPDVYQGTGHYQLVDHAASGLAGYASALGAKYTTARLLAERGIDLAVARLGLSCPPCATRSTPLAGGKMDDVEAEHRASRGRYATLLDDGTVSHLFSHYGTDLHDVVALGSQSTTGLRPLSATRPNIEAEVRYAVRHEMAVTLPDVVFRRTGLGTIGHPGTPCLQRCAELMSEELAWSPERVPAEIRAVEEAFTRP